MERGSSINIQNMKIEAYEHNHRAYTPSYAIDSADKNEYVNLTNDKLFVKKNNKLGEYKKIDFDKIKKILEDTHKKTTGRTAQKSTQWFKEAVINTNEKTTIEQLKKLSSVLEKQFNIIPLDIAHHKDEGYIESDKKHINYHCHLIFINANKQGITKKWDRAELKKLQDVVAEVLEMPRGVPGKNVRMEHQQYKKHINDIKKEQQQIIQEANKIIKSQNERIQLLEQQNKQLKVENREAIKDYNKLHNKLTELQQLFDSLNLSDINLHSENLNSKEIKKKLLEKIEEESKAKREELKQSGIATQKDYQAVKEMKEQKQEQVKTFFNIHKKDSQLTIG